MFELLTPISYWILVVLWLIERGFNSPPLGALLVGVL